MEQSQYTTSRKKFFLWALGIVTSIPAFRFMMTGKKKKDTVKMLTQDGRLVQIDKDMLAGTRRNITDAELKNWVKK